MFLTIALVASVLVPAIASFLSAAAGYNPSVYEPKDIQREAWLRDKLPIVPPLTWDSLYRIVLFIVVGVLWLTFLPGSRRR
ncbi:MAG: hypothetical protein HY294_03265 [Candidatus Rokubacteria bacterium]|nr:hypothetical protein [Candidatus Rokubacteria bacterium]MBI3824994.1 hypothetical protein [Candidatus Rokubacteria bacterium]